MKRIVALGKMLSEGQRRQSWGFLVDWLVWLVGLVDLVVFFCCCCCFCFVFDSVFTDLTSASQGGLFRGQMFLCLFRFIKYLLRCVRMREYDVNPPTENLCRLTMSSCVF